MGVKSEVHVEEVDSNSPEKQHLEALGLCVDDEGYICWHKLNRNHPRNWSWRRKCYDLTLIFWLDCFTTAISTAGPSAARFAELEFGIGHTQALVAFTLMYQLGQAIGGVGFPPYSESFGRKSVYVSAAFIYCIFCLMVALVPSIAGVYVGRFVTGLMSAIPSVVVEGSVEDMFSLRPRIWMIYAWACATTSGLVLGPVFGSYIGERVTWRWIFYVAAIVTGVTGCFILFMKESRPSRLLQRRLEGLQKLTGDESLRIRNPDHTPDLATFARTNLGRPVRLFFTEPIVFLVTIMSSIGWALIYLFTEALTVTYRGFGFSDTQTSLAFIPLLIGIFFGIIPRFYDQRVLQTRFEKSLPMSPEDKLVGFYWACPALALGLWWFAWTVPPRVTNVPWIVSMIGLVPVGFATNEFACVLSGYLADSYIIYASSAFAALAFLRAICAGSAPLFGTQMYEDLGSNIASSILAAVATVFCICPFIFSKYGKRIRQRSPFAKYSLRVHQQTSIDDDLLG